MLFTFYLLIFLFNAFQSGLFIELVGAFDLFNNPLITGFLDNRDFQILLDGIVGCSPSAAIPLPNIPRSEPLAAGLLAGVASTGLGVGLGLCFGVGISVGLGVGVGGWICE